MSRYLTHSITPEKLLVMSTNILHKSFYDCTRLEAKRRYQFLTEGHTVKLLDVRMEDGSELQINLRLDTAELRGRLNFSAFRQLIGQLLAAYTQKLNEKQALNTFSDDNKERWLYLIPALQQQGANVDMLILAANIGQPGVLLLELMFIDPDQFRSQVDGAPRESAAR